MPRIAEWGTAKLLKGQMVLISSKQLVFRWMTVTSSSQEISRAGLAVGVADFPATLARKIQAFG